MTNTPTLTRGEKYVLRYLAQHDGAAELTDLIHHADTCSASTAKKAVYALADKELCKRSDPGGPGDKATYRLTDKGARLADDWELC